MVRKAVGSPVRGKVKGVSESVRINQLVTAIDIVVYQKISRESWL